MSSDIKKVSDDELEIILHDLKPQLSESYKKSFADLAIMLESYNRAIQHVEFNNFKTARAIWNVVGYIIMASYDYKIVLKELTFASSYWERKFYSRQCYLIIFETMNDLLKLLNKDFREELRQLPFHEENIKELKAGVKRITSFKELYEPQIKDIRDKVAAHRDLNGLEHLKKIDSIHWPEAYLIAGEYNKVLNSLGPFLQRMLKSSNEQLQRLN
jgi:hypothetical protein